MKKNYSEYHKEYYGNKKLKRKFLKLFLGIFLIFSVGLLLFYNSLGITGKIISSVNPYNNNDNNSISIKTSITIPELSLDDSYKEVILNLNKGGIINLDNKKITLEEIENKVILKDFNGEIVLDENSIKQLKGKISEIRINNLPINLKDVGKLKISLSQDSKYSSFKIEENVQLRNLLFTSSGNILVRGDSLNLNSEDVKIKNYFGSLTIENKTLILEGLVESLNLEGDFRKISLSR